MKVTVDHEACIGCGSCVALCPEVFELGEDGKSHVKNPDACDQCNCQEAADVCPVGAITLE
ncbi:MAG: ferredoxin [Candidatus Aenigmatarchaeota archaeon]|nr:MAG: ferredoxin [Candidatus Aenigmarchaeota archaeon]